METIYIILLILVSIIGILYYYQERIKAWIMAKVMEQATKAMAKQFEKSMQNMSKTIDLGDLENGRKK